MFFFSRFLLSLSAFNYDSKRKKHSNFIDNITLSLKKLKSKLSSRSLKNMKDDVYFDLYNKHKRLESIISKNKYNLNINENDLKSLNEINMQIKKFKENVSITENKDKNNLLELLENEIRNIEKPCFKLKSGRLIFSINELYTAILNMPQKEYSLYCNFERNEFADWILNDLKNKEIAYELKEDNSKTNTLNVLRKKIKSFDYKK